MNLKLESQKTLKRILNQLDMSKLAKTQQKEMLQRLETHFPALFEHLFTVYGHHYDFYYHLTQLLESLVSAYAQRAPYLKKLDREGSNKKVWFKQENAVGMALYVDLYGGDLVKLKSRIDYLKSLGITYLHLMPLYKSPDGDSDGGYAVSDYRQVDSALGSVDDLRALAKALQKADIKLVLDFVFNHTSDEHEWAIKAKQGDTQYQNYYYIFPDKTIPELYEQHLREIFPQVRRGNFTYCEQARGWVWTTFNSFQWDLNYSNPELFNAVVGEMLFLANIGCDVLRLDALAFIWKEMGTNCENQPKAHSLIKAFKSCLEISSPSVVFKSEAIVHPNDVIKYISHDECELSYNPLLMALIWNSLATRKTRLITESLKKHGTIPSDCAWINYVRCHDDIGWTFDDEVAGQLGINGYDHRYFLNQFYTNKFEGSFASGVPFAENKTTGDCRVCGSLASLCGLEKAINAQDPQQHALAIQRILLVHGVIMSFGGIPLLYAGDELGVLNDYSYESDSSKVHDQRWVNRPNISDALLADAKNNEIYQAMQKLIAVRKANPVLGQGSTTVIDPPNQHCFAFVRQLDDAKCLCLFNFSEHELVIEPHTLGVLGQDALVELNTNTPLDATQALHLSSYQFAFVQRLRLKER
jgi:amylosucrase